MENRIFLVICLLGLIMLLSCRKTNDFGTQTKPNEQQVTLRLLMPQQSGKISTYAINEVNQNSIYTLDVLAFKVADDGKEHYAYHKRAVLLAPNEEATAVNFHVDLLKSTDNFRFVLIANAAAQLQTALNGLPTNAEKETLLGRIEYGITTKWNAASSANFTPLPMWGESVIVAGINNHTQRFSVAMLRSLAAIDVEVTANDFEMTQVYVFNMSNKGRVVPVPANYSAAGSSVTAPSVPANTGSFAYQLYASGSKALTGEIFLFESKAPANTGDSQATALVIAGKYAGSSTVTYYRVEMEDNRGNLLSILRNHRYVVDITKVHGAGFLTLGQAWASKQVVMTAEITKWNEVAVAEGNPGQYYLKLNVDNPKISGLPNKFILEVSTNAPGLQLTDLPDWITIDGQSTSGDKTSYTMKAAKNMTTKRRDKKISVKVANLTRKVNLTQYSGFIDLGTDFDVCIYPIDLYSPFPPPSWFYRANVQYENYSPLDASLVQKTGAPYPESCAELGPGYRLPTITELEQLIPDDEYERKAINNLISQKGGAVLFMTITGSPDYSVWSSTTVPNETNPANTNKRFYGRRMTGSNGSTPAGRTPIYKKDGNVHNLDNIRCVISRSDIPTN